MARRQELAHLDERRPQAFEGTPHADLARRLATLELGRVVGELVKRSPTGRVVAEPSVLEEKEDALVPEDRGDLAVAFAAALAAGLRRFGRGHGTSLYRWPPPLAGRREPGRWCTRHLHLIRICPLKTTVGRAPVG